MQIVRTVLTLCCTAISPDLANAYAEPGLGAGTIGVVAGIIGSLSIALFC